MTPIQLHGSAIEFYNYGESLQLVHTTVDEAIRHTLLQRVLVRVVATILKGSGLLYCIRERAKGHMDLAAVCREKLTSIIVPTDTTKREKPNLNMHSIEI